VAREERQGAETDGQGRRGEGVPLRRLWTPRVEGCGVRDLEVILGDLEWNLWPPAPAGERA